MSLYTRLIGTDRPRVPVHIFLSLAGEVARSQMNGNTAGNILGLSAAEKQDASAIIARVTGGFITKEELHEILMVASWPGGVSTPYRTEAALKTRLGIA